MSLRTHMQTSWPPLVLAAILLSSVLSAQESTHPIERGLVQETVNSLVNIVREEYFDADMAEQVAERLKAQLIQRRYDDVMSLSSLASRLTQDMFAVTNDRHLSTFVARKLDVDAKPVVTRDRRGRKENFGVKRVQILARNIGYLDLTHFYRLEEADETLAAAMLVLQNADALIIDMRANSGGSPDTVTMLVSYFFAEPNLPLFKITNRRSGNQQYSTEAKSRPGHDGTRPVFVLTSARTFSAGEGFAFILQERNRAMIIGEKTSGAANPGRPFPVNSQFEVVVPTGRITTAISGANWEGTGVKPDLPTSASDALNEAHNRAVRAISSP